MEPGPFALADRDWNRLVRSRSVRTYLAELAADPLYGDGFAADPITVISDKSPDAFARIDAVWADLLRRGQSEPLAQRIVLQALLPGLVKLVGRMAVSGNPAEFNGKAEQVLSIAGLHIGNYPYETRPRAIPYNLLRDTRRDFVRQRVAETAGETFDDAAEWEGPQLVGGEGHGRIEDLAEIKTLLEEALRARTIDASELRLIVETDLGGRDLADVALELGVRTDTARRARDKALERLRNWYRCTNGQPQAKPFVRKRRPSAWRVAAGAQAA